MIEFVNHVNRCLTCGRVPEMGRTKNRQWWVICCLECNWQVAEEDSIKAIQRWNVANPEPEKVRA